jgi:hypothetical protein
VLYLEFGNLYLDFGKVPGENPFSKLGGSNARCENNEILK